MWLLCEDTSRIKWSDIKDKISEEAIAKKYLKIKKIPTMLSSPLRDDKNPSMSIYYSKTGRVCYHDFGTGQHGTVIELVGLMCGLTFQETIHHIAKDMCLESLPKIKKHVTVLPEYELGVKIRKWNKKDMAYWGQYGISKIMLDKTETVPISKIYYKSESKSFVNMADEYAYAYIERKDNKPTVKIYQPYSQTHKWMGNRDYSIWELWNLLPPAGDVVILTSSRKDAMCLMCQLHVPCTALQSESISPKNWVMNQLIERFKKVYVWYDNDKAGLKYGKYLESVYPVEAIYTGREDAKDPSDFYKKYGGDELKLLWEIYHKPIENETNI